MPQTKTTRSKTIKKAAPRPEASSEENEAGLEMAFSTSKAKKEPNLDEEDALPAGDKAEDASPFGEASEDESGEEEAGLDDEEVNPFGDKWEE